MSDPDRDELYVGYLPAAPPGIAGLVRRAIGALLSTAALVAVLVAAAQGPVAPGTFEFGVVRRFAGTLEGGAHPVLRVDGPDGTTRYLLSAFGKHGADAEVAALVGRRVSLEGSLIDRDGLRMIEVREGSVTPDGDPAASPPDVALGRLTLVGEIVDSKCHLGVMKPGDGKPHRDCAVRCISGGIPPLLWARDERGGEVHALLVGRGGRPIGRELLDRIGEPVEASGEAIRRGGLVILEVEPADVRRLARREGRG